MIKFFTYTYFLTAIGAGFLYLESCYHLNILNVDIFEIKDQLLFVVLATLGLYNGLQALPRIMKRGSKKDTLFYTNAFLALISAVYCIWFASRLSADKLFYIGHLFLIGIAYILPIFGKPLREIPFIKLFIIAYVWTAVTVMLPIRLNFWNSDVFTSVFLNRLNFILMMSITFDISHRKEDIHDGLATLPTVFGNHISRLAIPLGLIGVISALNISPQYGVILAVVDFGMAIIMFQSPSLSRGKLFAISLDGMMCLKFLLLLAGQLI